MPQKRRNAGRASLGAADGDLQLALAMSLSVAEVKQPAKRVCTTEPTTNNDANTGPSSGDAATSSGVAATPGAQTAAASADDAQVDEEPYVDPLPPTLLVIDRERPVKSLGEAGLIPFGEKVLYMKYKEYEWWVDVSPDGMLTHHGGDGTQYPNPSKFSLAMKRSINPGAVSDSGWESLRYKGRKLAHVRDGVEKLLRTRKERKARAGIPGMTRAKQSAIFKGVDRKKEALVKEVITHYKQTKVEDNEGERIKRRKKRSQRNYEQLAKVIEKLKGKDRYAFFQEPPNVSALPGYLDKIPHPPIDFTTIDRRYRESKRVFSDSQQAQSSTDLYMEMNHGANHGVAEIKYDRLLRDVTQIVENAQAYFERDDRQGTPYAEAGWMLKECTNVLSSFQKRVTNTLRQQRQKDRLEMIREKNRQPCVQGKWHKLPYKKREYRMITAYEPSQELSEVEAHRVMRKLRTTMTRDEYVAAVNKEDQEFQSLCDSGAPAKESGDSNAAAEAADAAKPSKEVLALEQTARDRSTVEWRRLRLDKGDIIERDTWGIDCYTRKNIELALGLVPAPLTMSQSQATYFVENVFLPAVNAVENPDVAHDIQHTLSLLQKWYSGPAPNGSYAETGPGPVQEFKVAVVGEDTICGICGTSERPEEVLLCDGPDCDKEFHMSCLTPAVTKVPDGDFIGPCCGGHGAAPGTTNRQCDEAGGEAAKYELRSDGQKTWIPSLADSRAPRREQVAAGVSMIAEVVQDIGMQHFAIHPKGCGVILATEHSIPANRFVTEYLGAVYPAWLWTEKDRKEEEQRKKDRSEKQKLLTERVRARKAAAKQGKKSRRTEDDEDEEDALAFQVPEFYNIRLERSRADPEGYDLLYVDAKDHAAFSSRMSHSCAPNCALEGTIVNGQYTIAVRTLRPIRPGEELTQDYNCVTESEQEFRAAVCLCGGIRCRGSFLNFIGAAVKSLLLKQYQTRLHRLAALCGACTDLPNTKSRRARSGADGASKTQALSIQDVEEAKNRSKVARETESLRSHVSAVSCLGSSALQGQPLWGLRWCAAVLRFMNNERQYLPRELDEMQALIKATGTMMGSMENAKVAVNVYEQRVSNLVTALDIIRHCVSKSSTTSAPTAVDSASGADKNSSLDNSHPFRRLPEGELKSFLVVGSNSVLSRTLALTTASMHALCEDSSVSQSDSENDTPQNSSEVQSEMNSFSSALEQSWREAVDKATESGKASASDDSDGSSASEPSDSSSTQQQDSSKDIASADQITLKLLQASDAVRQWITNSFRSFSTQASSGTPDAATNITAPVDSTASVASTVKKLKLRRLDRARCIAWRAVQILRLYATTKNFFALNVPKEKTKSVAARQIFELVQHAFQWFDQHSLDLKSFAKELRLIGYLPPVYTMDNFGDSPAPGKSSKTTTRADVHGKITFDWANRHFLPHLRTSPFDPIPDKLASALGFAGTKDADCDKSSESGDDGPQEELSATSVQNLVFGSPMLDVLVGYEIRENAKAAQSAGTAHVSRPKRKSRFPSATCGDEYAQTLTMLKDTSGSTAKLHSASIAAAQPQVTNEPPKRRPTLVLYHKHSKRKSPSGKSSATKDKSPNSKRARGSPKDPNQPKKPPNGFFLYCTDQRAIFKRDGVTFENHKARMTHLSAGWSSIDPLTKNSYRQKADQLYKKYQEDLRVYLANRPQDKPEQAQPAESAPEPEKVVEQDWVQCQSCSKWRKVPSHAPVFADVNAVFVCSMNEWDTDRQSCDAPEESWDDVATQEFVYKGVDFDPNQLRKGDWVEARDRHGCWYAAECLERQDTKIFVHYYKWAHKYDEWIDVVAEQERLAPLFTFVKSTKDLAAKRDAAYATTTAISISADSNVQEDKSANEGAAAEPSTADMSTSAPLDTNAVAASDATSTASQPSIAVTPAIVDLAQDKGARVVSEVDVPAATPNAVADCADSPLSRATAALNAARSSLAVHDTSTVRKISEMSAPTVPIDNSANAASTRRSPTKENVETLGNVSTADQPRKIGFGLARPTISMK